MNCRFWMNGQHYFECLLLYLKQIDITERKQMEILHASTQGLVDGSTVPP
jgi:hypothetical protein